MNAAPAHWDDLPKGTPERAVFKLASYAVANTLFGGAGALVIAKRAVRMGLRSGREMMSAVSDVYAFSSGRVPGHLHPWKCSECDSVHVEWEGAANCCREDFFDAANEFDEEQDDE